MALSIDLRKRVIGAVDSGMSVKNAAIAFSVCKKAIFNWLKLRRETGSLKPKTGYQKGHSHKITDWDLFKKFVQKHQGLTSPYMIIEWEKLTQVKVSESVMLRALRKIGHSF
jgi:transposase